MWVINLLYVQTQATIKAARASMRYLLDVNVERMKTEASDLPLLVVGGGAILVDWPRSVSIGCFKT